MTAEAKGATETDGVTEPNGANDSYGEVLRALDSVLAERRSASAETSYVASLYHRGLNKILEKVGEESTEVILAAKENEDGSHEAELIGEVADLWFHTMVLLAKQGLSAADVIDCLDERFGVSGHVEKAARESGTESDE